MIILSNLFIVIYLVYAWSWHLPQDTFSKRIVSAASPLIMWMGLWHSWKMFAPRPSLVNRRLVIELVHANRRKTVIEDINLAKLSRWSAFLHCRERKYQTNLAGSDYKSHWDALCRYAAKNYTKIESPVVRVNLSVARQRIADPDATELNPYVSSLLWKCDIRAES